MPSPDTLVVRLVVWEGKLREGGQEQAQIKAHIDVLKRLVNESVDGTQWSYQRWKLHPSTNGAQKFEISIRRENTRDQQDRTLSIHHLCDKLLNSELATELRLQYPAVSFTFTPSQEGTITTTDRIFARCFSTALVRRYCLGTAYSEELERRQNEFLTRNSTKYLYQPMLVLHSAAELTERYDLMILTLVGAAEMINGDKRNVLLLVDAAGAVMNKKIRSGVKSKEFRVFANQAIRTAANRIKSRLPNVDANTAAAGSMDEKFATSEAFDPGAVGHLTEEEAREAAKLAISIGCQFVRAFVAYSGEMKKELGAKLRELNEAIIKVRLALATDAYMNASTAPIQALTYLHDKNLPNSDDLAMTINAFGTLMQTTLPLFTVTLNITDKEFASVFSLATKAGIGLVTTGGAGMWMMLAGATAGPVGLLAVASVSTVVLGTAAIGEALKWSEREKTNPTKTLLTIQKVMEECARFLLSLLFVQADMSPDDDRSHLVYVEALKGQLGKLEAERLCRKEYQQAYFKNTSEQLAKEMTHLQKGLQRYIV